MFLLAAYAAITVSGGAAAVAPSRDRRFGASTADIPALQYWPPAATIGEVVRLGGTGAGGFETFSADAGGAAIKARALAPSIKGDVASFLDRPDVRNGVDEILEAVEVALPGYQTLLEVVKSPDDDPEDAFLMVNVVMREDDTQAWDLVEALIDQKWLQLPAHVRGAMGVGRELVPVG